MNKLELLEALRNTDETTLLELLEINSSMLVDAFLDVIEDNLSKLYSACNEEDQEV